MIRKHACRLAGVLALAFVATTSAFASLWERTTPSPLTNNITLNWVANYEAFRLDQKQLNRLLAGTPEGEWWHAIEPVEIEIPHPTGGTQRFKIIEYAMMSDQLRAQIPVKTYQLRGVDDLTATGCIDIGVNGLHGFFVSSKGAWVIDPAWRGSMSDFAVFYRGDNLRQRVSTCTVFEPKEKHEEHGNAGDGPGDTLRRYRLAMNATGEYTAFHGGVAGAQNAIITSINRNNVVYLRDLAVRMELVRNNPYPDAGTDPFSNNSGGTMLGQNQTVCDGTIGDANYDIGHVFSTGGGGVAGLGVLRVSGQKARGVTGSPVPVGDPFDIDYVAHEIGHQFGANHTFNTGISGCGSQRNSTTAYEVGSASTIMGYAGICPPEDVQSNSDDYFHLISILEITPVITSRTWINEATGNITPTVSVPGTVTIPQNTPYRLTSTGADGNGDALTYCWEQWDLGSATTSPAQFSTGPLVRSIDPLPTGTRWIPAFNKVRDNISDPWEKLANTNRNTNWRVTVRDNRAGGGGYVVGSRLVTVSGSQFRVTSPNTAVSWQGGSNQTITWDVGGGSVAANVNILLSTNSGNSYETGTATMVLANTPNDGSQVVTIPNVATTTARIIVEPVGNIFYDMSDTNFTITVPPPAPTITSITPNTRQAGIGGFTLTVNGTNFINGVSFVRWNGVNKGTTFVSSTQLNALITANDVAFTGNATVTVFQNSQTSNGANFTITPGNVTTINPNAVQLIQGQLIGGVLASLNTVDGNRYVILSDENAPDAEVWISATSPFTQLYQLQVILNAISTRDDLSVFTELLDHANNAWEQVGFFVSTTSSANYTYTVPQASNPTQYVRTGDRLMRVRVLWIPSSDLDSGDGWSQSLDRAVFTVQP